MKSGAQIKKLPLSISSRELENFCKRWKVSRLEIFGSALHGDFNAGNSDADLLVTFTEDAERSMLDKMKMQDELEKIFKREVDLISREAIEKSGNWVRRDSILRDSKVIYGA